MERCGRRGRRWLVVAAATALVAGLGATGAGAGAGAAGPAGSAGTVVTVDAAGEQGRVNPAVLGHAYLWPFAGMGSFDARADRFYPRFLDQLRAMGPGSLRWPGGITGETFDWRRAVGPQSRRTPNAFGPGEGPSASTVGPDEFGRLLERTRATGVGTVSFALGDAAEAAGFVAYLTGRPGTSRWADLRARNGHPAPYSVPYWEVGNEESIATYWRSGTPVTVGGPPGACASVAVCLYLYGGSTRFADQATVGYADRTPAASHSSGAAGQDFYVAYPPVQTGSDTISVAGAAWTRVARLSTAGPADRVYTIDPSTGRIRFGDGRHGAIPPAGAAVAASYVSGPHDGFVDFYRAMKAANPHIRVCSTEESADFVAAAGARVPYDCLQHHATYVSSDDVPNDTPLADYQKKIMAAPDREAQGTADLERAIVSHAGHPVPLVLTEYGQFLNANPTGQPYYHDSLDEALVNASQLAHWIRLGVPVADRQLLTAEIPPPERCCVGLPGAAPFATTGAIGTPGPDTVLEATGAVYRLFAPLGGGRLLPTTTAGNPVLTTDRGQPVDTLSTLAVRDHNAVYVVAINRSPDAAVGSRLRLDGVHIGRWGTASTLNGPSSLSYNTTSAPRTVRIGRSRVAVRGGEVAVTLPAHSVTTLRLPIRP